MQDMVKTNGMAKTLSAKFQNMSKITKEASPPSAGKRKNVTQACTICRSKKTKCDGHQPCSSCGKQNDTCTYDGPGVDRRGKRSTGTQHDELCQADLLLTALIETIRDGKDETVRQHIRDGATRQQLAQILSDSTAPASPFLSVPTASIEHSQPTSSFPPTPTCDPYLPSLLNAADMLLDRSTWHPSLQLRYQNDEVVLGSKFPPFAMRSGFPYNDTTSTHQATFSADPLESYQMLSSTTTAGYDQTLPSHEQQPVQFPHYLVLPRTQVDHTFVGDAYTSFLLAGRERTLQGDPVDSIMGSLAVDAELFVRRRHEHDPFTAATWACELSRSFFGQGFAYITHLAAIVGLSRLMRWMLHPCAETYAAIPVVYQPTDLQRIIPHMASLDLVLWGTVRDSLIFEDKDFVTAFAEAGINVSWPHTINEALTFDISTGRMQVSTRFIDHITDTESWKVGSAFLKKFPDLEGASFIDPIEHIPMTDNFL